MKSDHSNPPCGGVLHGAKDRTITGMSTLFAEKTGVLVTVCVAKLPAVGGFQYEGFSFVPVSELTSTVAESSTRATG